MVDGISPFDAEKAYKDSKLCNLLFAGEFERRAREQGTPLTVIAWSPGLVIPRGRGGFFRFSRAHNEWGQRLFAFLARDLLRLSESVADAGALLATLATDPAEEAAGFRYRANRLIAPGRHRLEAATPSAEASDSARAGTLWDLTEGLAAMLEEGTAAADGRH
jgi:protochlorophyllide reductase